MLIGKHSVNGMAECRWASRVPGGYTHRDIQPSSQTGIKACRHADSISIAISISTSQTITYPYVVCLCPNTKVAQPFFRKLVSEHCCETCCK